MAKPTDGEVKADHDVEDTVWRHIDELKTLAAKELISEQDHDVVGRILCVNIGLLIGLSDRAWEQFTRIVDESRKVHYGQKGDSPKRATQ